MPLDPTRSARIQDLFLRALELPTSDRAAFLARESGGDEALAREVDSLLGFAAERTGHDGLTTGAFAAQAIVRQPGDRVGAFTIVQPLGSGAMGDVYLATQDEPRRQVALKILRLGSDADRLARFRFEGAALARLNHENVARVYATGESEDGQPFIALELVPGRPLTEYADGRRLSVEQRLRLFTSICDALEHIHQNGLIHRDLKPANVVVLETPSGPVPKLIDFGVVKSFEDSLREGQRTIDGALLGTLEYASPEQLVDSRSVDTRSDIYSAGVILHELLVGTRPFVLRDQGILEFVKAVRSEEIAPPSAVLARDAASLAAAAALRGTSPPRLLEALRSDLDWIVQRALRRAPADRYPTAGSLRADVHRYLAREPVRARPPSPGYRLRKGLARHRNAVIVGGALLVAVVGGLGATLWQAEVARARLRDLDRVTADLVTSINDIVDVPGAMQAKRRLAASAAQALERITARSSDPGLDERLATADERLGQLMADPYTASLAQTRPGLGHLRRALAIRRRLHLARPDAANALKLMQSAFTLAITVQSDEGGHNDTDSLCVAGMALGRALVARDSNDWEAVRVLSMVEDLHSEYVFLGGRWDSTLTLMREAYGMRLRLVRGQPGADEPVRLLGQSLGRMAYAAMDARTARSCASGALAIAEGYQLAHPFSFRAMLDLSFAARNMAYALRQCGKADSAVAFYRRGVAVRERMAMSDTSDLRSYDLLSDLYDVSAEGYLAVGRMDSARVLESRALQRRLALAARPDAPPWVAGSLWFCTRTQARIAAAGHRWAEADSLYSRIAEGDAFWLPVDGVHLWRLQMERAHARMESGDHLGGLRMAAHSAALLARLEAMLRAGRADPVPFGDVALAYVHLAQLNAAGTDTSIALLRRAIALPGLDADPREPRARALNELGCRLADAGLANEAGSLLRDALHLAREARLHETIAWNLSTLHRPARTAAYAAASDPYAHLAQIVFRKWTVWGELPIPPLSRRALVRAAAASGVASRELLTADRPGAGATTRARVWYRP